MIYFIYNWNSLTSDRFLLYFIQDVDISAIWRACTWNSLHISKCSYSLIYVISSMGKISMRRRISYVGTLYAQYSYNEIYKYNKNTVKPIKSNEKAVIVIFTRPMRSRKCTILVFISYYIYHFWYFKTKEHEELAYLFANTSDSFWKTFFK